MIEITKREDEVRKANVVVLPSVGAKCLLQLTLKIFSKPNVYKVEFENNSEKKYSVSGKLRNKNPPKTSLKIFFKLLKILNSYSVLSCGICICSVVLYLFCGVYFILFVYCTVIGI